MAAPGVRFLSTVRDVWVLLLCSSSSATPGYLQSCSVKCKIGTPERRQRTVELEGLCGALCANLSIVDVEGGPRADDTVSAAPIALGAKRDVVVCEGERCEGVG